MTKHIDVIKMLSEDFLFHWKRQNNNQYLEMDDTDLYEYFLELDSYFRELSNGTKNLATFDIPDVHADYVHRNAPYDNSLLRQVFQYNIYVENYYMMNIDQKTTCVTIQS